MARLLLSHEDALNAISPEMAFMAFAQTGQGGVVRSMVEVSQAWHGKAKGTALMEKTPLCMVMLTCLLKKLGESHEANDRRRSAEKRAHPSPRLLTNDGAKWHQMTWSQEKEQLVPTDAEQAESQGPTPGVDHPGPDPWMGLRFHAPHSLSQVVTKEGQSVVAWKLILGHRIVEAIREKNANVSQRAHTALTAEAEACQHASQPAGPKGWQHADKLIGPRLRAGMQQWRLANTQLHCYMNSCTWAHMWCITYLPEPAQCWGLLGDFGHAADLDPALPSSRMVPNIAPKFFSNVWGFNGEDTQQDVKMAPANHTLRSPSHLQLRLGACAASQCHCKP